MCCQLQGGEETVRRRVRHQTRAGRPDSADLSVELRSVLRWMQHMQMLWGQDLQLYKEIVSLEEVSQMPAKAQREAIVLQAIVLPKLQQLQPADHAHPRAELLPARQPKPHSAERQGRAQEQYTDQTPLLLSTDTADTRKEMSGRKTPIETVTLPGKAAKPGHSAWKG